MTLRDLYYNYTGYPEDNMPKEHLTTNKLNIYGGGGLGNFFGNIGRWVAHPFNKTARYNASVQSNPNSYGSGEITNFNTTGNGTTDWGSIGGFATGQTSQNNITNPYQGTTMMEQSFAQTGTPTAETVDGNAFADISKSGKSEGTWTRGGGGIPWGSIVSAAGTNIANAFLDTEASTADRVAGALGIPALANQWRADTSKGDAYIKDMQNSMDLNPKNYIQDASSSWGGANAVKQNLKTNITPISFNSAVPSLKDFKGNWWRNMGASVAQGAASGSVGGPWGALGGAVTGLFGSIGGLFGRSKRADRAYKDFLAKRNTLISAQEAAYNRAVKDQTLSNMQALTNGNTQQRISDMANIRAYGGNLYNIKDMGGNLYTDLSPNMMSLWNNKQQIDQQKVNMQQMNFGLGNSFNYKNMFPNGGQMDSSDLPDNAQYYGNGGTHEQNPYGGIQVGVDQQGNPNLVEEGEFRWGDYVFSDRINVDPTLLSRYNLAPATKHQGKKANKGKLSYADMAKKYAKKNKELANDPIGKNTLEAYMKRLQDAQEDQKFQDSMEQQKQDAINQYRNALTTPQQGNPMYGAMKYSGMGNAATQQGVNAGMSDLGQQGGGNEVLSNTNRSGNNMLHAFGGNLFWDGGTPQIKPKLLNVNPNLVLGDDYMNNWTANNAGTPRLFSSTTPMYTGENPEANFTAYQKRYPTLPSDAKDMQQLLVNEGFDIGNTGPNKDGVDGIWGNKSQAAWYDFLRAYNHRPNTMNQYDLIGSNNQPSTSNSQASYSGGLNLGVRDGDATTDANNLGDGQTSYGNAEGNTNIDRSNSAGNTNTGNTTTGTYATNAFKEDREGVPLYSTAGKFATFGKGLTPMLYDWMNKTNTKYDPNQRPANELVDMGNNSTFLRTADTIGGYRAPNLMDAERMNNAAQAQGLAALQSALSVGNGNRGFAAAQANQQMYNTGMGIGNNYATAQQANNEERYKTDAYNTTIDQFNANARNTSYQDNQKAQQLGQQMALSAKQAANDYLQKENWYADRTNRTAMDNRATNQAAWTDNALNYFITQAQENAERNRQNNDITKRYWSDKDGVMHYIGDSGLNGKIREYFRKNKIDNGTFTGDRLAAFNSIIQNNKAKDVANEKGELWSTVQGLMDDEIAARNKEIADADKAKAERLTNAKYAFDNNMAQLDNYRSMYGDKFTDSQWYDDLMKRYNDKANTDEFNDINNIEYWNKIIGDKLNYWQRYNTPVTANQSAYGGRINNGNKNNKNGYYTYTY
jgi:hypothetical protein